MSSKYSAIYTAAELTHTLLNPTLTSPLTTLGDKQTVDLRQIAEIFTKPPPHPQETPFPRVHTQKKTLDVAPAPPPRVEPKGDISFRTGRVPRRPTQCVPHIIPDDTKPLPPAAHKKASETPRVPQEHRYNTRARRIQGQYLMENHVTTINTPTYTPSKPAPLVCPAGED